ncbi:MAG: CinA family protein [Bdellovibrionales bacterium]|nr:CinA family protein [Bdellovibrionales bacterium]
MDNNLDLILSELTLRGQRLSLAESCTGGLLSGKLVGTSGISAVYLGGVVAYSNEIKEKVLGVSPSLIKTLGAVSDATALAMARGVKRLTGSSWAVSITGIAGPNGGTDKKPVGTVWFAVVGPGIEVAEKKLFSGDRSQIQKQSVDFALDLLKRNIKRQRADAPLEE